MRRTPGVVRLAGAPARRLPVLHHRRADHQPAPGVRAGEPDPADVPRARARRPSTIGRARAGAPVVRRLRRGRELARHLAQRGRGDLHGGAVRRDARRPRRPAWLEARYDAVRRDADFWNLDGRRPRGRPTCSTGAVYDRGAMTLQALRQRIGDAGLLAAAAPLGRRAPRRQRLDRGVRGAGRARSAARTSTGSSTPGCATPGARPPRTGANGLRLRSGPVSRAGAPTGRSRSPRASRTR